MNYLVLYQGGMAGTWLAWLINQHANFPKYIKHTKESGLDIGCWGADWETLNETFKESRQHVISNTKKDCIKVVPFHELRDPVSEQAELKTELRDLVFSEVNPVKVIYPVVTTMREEFIARWNKLELGNPATEKGWIEWDWVVDQEEPYGDIVKIDIGKLLSGDIWQYYKLCNEIEEEPLENIQELIDDYKKFFV
jgi:hypothetical protein